MLAHAQDDVRDRGPRAGAPGSERFCAATGTLTPVGEMIRFVVAPDGTAVPDLKRRLPGRGLWITATRQALQTAVARKLFARGFKREVRVAANFVDMTERLLEKAALDALGMAHKAGKVAIGFTRTEAALAKERVAAVLHAADAAAEGSRKLAAFLRRQDPADAENVPVVNTFGTMQLDLALGRSNVVHAALLGGPESETFLERLWRLERFRTGSLHGQGQHKAGAARR